METKNSNNKMFNQIALSSLETDQIYLFNSDKF